MSAFYNNMTAATNVSDALIDLWEKAFLLAAYQQDVTSQFADVRQIAGKTEHIMKYTNFAPATTPLTETIIPSSDNIHTTTSHAGRYISSSGKSKLCSALNSQR